jgi:signal transduction histidine kinase
MSLRARLRIAIATLMTAVVVVLSVLYIQEFLISVVQRTDLIADSIGSQVQAATVEVLKARRASLASAPLSPEELRRFWISTIQSDSTIAATLRDALEHWDLIREVYIADDTGHILVSSDPHRAGRQIVLTPVTDGRPRTLFGDMYQVFFAKEVTERSKSLGVVGEPKPVVTAHVVIASAFVRNSLLEPLKKLFWVFCIALITSILLATILPNLVLDPLEKVARRIDLMATGEFPPVNPNARREAREVAAVYSKLNLLGKQYQGARENVDDLRTNVQQLLERLEQAVLMVDPAGRLIMAGKNAGLLLGNEAESLNGKLLTEVFPPDSEAGRIIIGAILERIAIRDQVVTFEVADTQRKLSVTVEPLLRGPEQRALGTLIMLRDVETRGELVAELGLADRLSALGRLTHGVAHEIKNPLNAITLHLEILRNRLETEAPEVDVIGREISRLDRVVKTFLDFNRPVNPQMKVVDLSELIQDLNRLIKPETVEKNIAVVLDCPDGVLIDGDRDLLKQAVLNVLMNAIEAMPEGGKLTVSTRRSGSLTQLSIADTGGGIPPEVQDRIFNLYFSTKTRGSGIGLAMAFRFVQLHNGKLEFTSQSGAGTTFRFTFPEAVSATRTQHLLVSQSQSA